MPSSSTPLTSSRPNLLDALFIVRLFFLDVLVVSSRRRLSRPAEATLATPAAPFRRCRRRSHPKGVKFDRTSPCGARDALEAGDRGVLSEARRPSVTTQRTTGEPCHPCHCRPPIVRRSPRTVRSRPGPRGLYAR